MARPGPIKLPKIERILEIYDFNLESGIFTHRRLNRQSGYVRPSGHVFITIDRRHYGAHRLAYLIAYGVDPGDFFVDHVNREPADNRPTNLRLATLTQNSRNLSGARRDSSSGIRGVRWRERDKSWYASIRIDGKSVHVGCFRSKQEAVIAVSKARQKSLGEFSGEM